ncbi:MAG TPA: hypothetical protein VLG74_05070 [Blastocatellia bacterium]|nr:hypothetical protein [Blastocatellia bacterium]
MIKKILTVAIAGLLIQAVCVQPASAASKAEREAQRAEKVKAGILKLGMGTDARVAIKLRDKMKLAGYVTEVSDGSFVVTDPKTRAATTVAYGDVTQVKGHNLGTGAKVAIGIGIGVGVTLLVIWLIVQNYSD